MKEMKRGELAVRTGCNIETIRFYEKEGILPNPPRTAAGHRLYGAEHLKRLSFILRCRELGFTLEQTRSLLALVDGNDYTCAEVREAALAHVDEVRRKIEDLKVIDQVLSDMAAKCDGGDVPDCPIIDTLFAEE
ncbi:MerR family transcriptional regulator [Aestuariispira insulae]|uniref:Transcriptional regulator n=1 Tax=Aestuariispira insulae TaxID=1461337 RepID=A0A3D9H1G6_9PROT|nr:helix-turn-helix domain-containing protein [Aestuariispira insulae]RED43334.1 transcriptional regulator [Aestuariispira insulae]